ncbi:class I SAM-dependent methyltransferase [Methylobacterium soli]|uniref:Methyltransferase domain-containing protein n=1 Tax=Methylobacterium soli TaxID=553447 RepID=A0A6L3SQ60_9HYPH|nr:class I SAM-dependent methyltransferase [Methylobacterium soli]KAB1072882.1 methyltransferase domain-containing protein [Methylobacterium soli]GJE41347.1 tRNA 5-carboxymethoxyuridine methyltransferase [Methylobacterium soli]
MTAWTEGYVADIPYALGFYRETVPAHVAFSAACVGKHPGLALQPQRVLELGFGMGLGFVINAAANPGTHFEGIDFNPLHVAHARGLVDDAELTNVSLREASFQDLAREAQEGQHDLDLIVLHGILTWVSSDAHESIVEIARKRLKPGGFLYVSYNCMPGWAPVLPLQRLMRENAKRVAGRSDEQTESGLELVKALMSEGANYFAANAGLQQRIEKMSSLDRNYLAHEYLNANWFIFHFADVAEMFGRAKLGFVGSATLVENIDNLALPKEVKARVAAETDVVFKETLRDIASNKQFRRDLFARGVSTLNSIEHNSILGAMQFSLALPRSQVTFKIPSPVGELNGNAEIYGAVADLLAEKTASFAEIASLPAFREGGAGAALQAVTLFVHSGQVLPVPVSGSSNAEFDRSPAQRLNRVIAEKMLQGRTFNFLAAPAVGSGIQVATTDLLMIAAVLAGEGNTAETVTAHVLQSMQHLGINWVKDGKAITDPSERTTIVTGDARSFLSEKLPVWQRLGIL